ncbi:MAG TPA: SET domain-containing protein [Gemmataceae bacterium]|jgi:hypothetical protein|nr:SET domain-containing protein [Gemmataceae bacterium]
MLVVETYLSPSGINGFGIFAKEPIPNGSPVWEFTPGFDLELTIDDLPSPAREYVLHYGNRVRADVFLLCGDNARFMNHSDTPNVSAADGRNHALCDIAAGEEITCNYAEFDLDFKGTFAD